MAELLVTGAGSPRLLLVEDNAEDEELALWELGRLGLDRVAVARDGVQALALLRTGDLPRAVLLDLRLPGMDGTEVLAALRREARTRDLPVIILSSSEDPRELACCRKLGIEGVLPKPLDGDALLRLLLA